jgi:Protein of unknown function (DUF1566)
MSEDESVKNAQLAKLEAERRKLELEADEIRRRLKAVWYIGRVGQSVVAGIVAAGLFAAWTIGYFQPLLTADTELAKRRNETNQLRLQDAETTLAKQRGSLDEQGRLNEALSTQLKDKDKALQQTIVELALLAKKANVPEDIRASISSLVARYAKAPAVTTSAGVVAVALRAEPTIISRDEIFDMIRSRGFSLPSLPIQGDFRHDYEVSGGADSRVITDHATGLMWQQSGSSDKMSYGAAQAYIGELNRNKFAGFSNWRLPTIEELASLVDPTQKNGALYVDPSFDGHQSWCRSSDKESDFFSWGIVFSNGSLYKVPLAYPYYVRAVRSILA